MRTKIFLIFAIISLICSNLQAEKYAILISAGKVIRDDDNYHSEYWYDLFLAYEDLILNEGYTHNNIYVCYGDGQSFSSTNSRYQLSLHNWSNIVDYNNTKSSIESAFQTVANLVSEDDHIHIRWVCGHGTNNYNSSTRTNDKYAAKIENRDYWITEQELINYVNHIDDYKRKLIFWQTCYAGCLLEGTKNLSSSKNYVLTCSDWDEVSYSIEDDDWHCEFNYYATSYLYGESPSGSSMDADANNDNQVSMSELKTSTYSGVSNSTVQQDGYDNYRKFTSISGLISNMSSSGTLLDDEIWFGQHTLTGSITVPTGKILYIDSDAEIRFPSYSSLTVNGKIIAIGTSSSPITFTSSSTWNCIRLESAGTSTFDYCELENSIYGIVLDGSSPTITNCYIHDNDGYGLDLINGSSPRLEYNTISNNVSYGLYCSGYCEPKFGEYPSYSPAYGYNVITSNGKGIDARNNSNVIAGIMYYGVVPNCSNNSIHSNTNYDAYADNSNISAEWNWWGTAHPSSSQFYTVNGGTISIQDTCGADPGGGSSLAKSLFAGGGKKFDPTEVDRNDPQQLLELAKYQRSIVKEEEALETLKDLISRFPNSEYSEKAIVSAFHISKDIDDGHLKSYLKSQKSRKLPTNLQNIVTDLIILKCMENKEYQEAQKYCLEKLEENTSDLFALYHLVSISKNYRLDLNEAKYYLSEMKCKYPNEDLTILAMEMMGEKVDWSDVSKGLEKSNPGNSIESIDSEFTLHPAHPNPFNPSTNISFSLEKQSKVDIHIYNLKGQEVWNWRNNLEYGSGYHNITWNATDDSGGPLSSGVYFVRLIAGNKVATQKIIFMK